MRIRNTKLIATVEKINMRIIIFNINNEIIFYYDFGMRIGMRIGMRVFSGMLHIQTHTYTAYKSTYMLMLF